MDDREGIDQRSGGDILLDSPGIFLIERIYPVREGGPADKRAVWILSPIGAFKG